MNFTDGLDGLAGGVMMTIFTGYLAMTVWQYSHRCVSVAGVGCYDVHDAGALTIITATFGVVRAGRAGRRRRLQPAVCVC